LNRSRLKSWGAKSALTHPGNAGKRGSSPTVKEGRCGESEPSLTVGLLPRFA